VLGSWDVSLKNNPTITNNGAMILEGYLAGTYLKIVDNSTVTFTGDGDLLLQGNHSALNNYGTSTGYFINAVDHTIRGWGTISAPLINNGRVIAENQWMQIDAEMTGSGSVAVDDNATLLLKKNATTGNFYMRELARLTVSNNVTLALGGNFAFAQTNETYWSWGSNTTLEMNGGAGSAQALEVGGTDLGAAAGGFTSNFDLGKLVIEGTGTQVYLENSIDNGNGTVEALYVDSLTIGPGASLNLNGLKLYTYLNSQIHLVQPGEGGSFGGGTIIDSSVSPPDILVDPIAIDFGEVGLGEKSPAHPVRISNEGSGTIVVESIDFSGDSGFQLTDDECSNTLIGSDEECEIRVEFAPDAGGLKNAILSIISNDPYEAEVLVTLSGTAVCRGDLDGDGDVDGKDLAEFSDDPAQFPMSSFSACFGHTDCLP